jgi:hypothetical protein
MVIVSVPDPDPPDPHVFGPAESGSFYHQAKKGKKNLDSHCFVTFLDFSSSKNDVNVPLKKSKKQKNFVLLVFCWGL